MKQLRIGTAVLLCVCAGAIQAEAQQVASTFDQLAVLVKPGDKISVVDVTGRETRGRIAQLSGARLILDDAAGPVQLSEAQVARISQRRSDSLKNGALIGAAAGAAYFATMMAIMSQFSDGGDVIIPSAISGAVLVVGMGAAAGAGIDALISRRQVIYQKAPGPGRVGLSPLVGHGRRGVAVTVKF
jgi:hypothetical protein